MAHSPMSLLLLRRLSPAYRSPKFPRVSYLLSPKPYSNSTTTSSPDAAKAYSLSSRMSFIFEQIDAIQGDCSENDPTLQRIRSWRQTRVQAPPQQNPELTPQSIRTQKPEEKASQDANLESRPQLAEPWSVASEVKKVELEHPWPEWLELMERLVQQTYFDHKRKDEDKLSKSSGLDALSVATKDDGSDDGDVAGVNFKNFKTVNTACVDFGKDRFDIMRSLSRQDFKVLVGYGCANTDKKVIFSSKLLRKYAHLDEGDVCSNCSLRSSCERAYLITNKEDDARTIDVMRVLVAYGFDAINGSVVNKSLMQQKSVKTVVRKLIHQVVKLSAVPIDPNLPPPVIKKPPPKVKQPPPPPKKRVGRYDVEMKKGDWLCTKCDFMNFAKNAICLQCDAKRPKRQLLPGEWECPECNFVNYRRNMTCFHCDCKRPADEFVEDKMEQKQHGHGKGLEKASHVEVSNAWNFDFDDNESDGADIAAFEYADLEARTDDPHMASQVGDQSSSRPGDGFNGAIRTSRVHDREYPNPNHDRFGRGFDDFDDEDDSDSCEADNESNSPAWRTSHKKISVVDNLGSEDLEDLHSNMHIGGRTGFSSHDKASNLKRKKASFSDFEDEPSPGRGISAHPKWKSSHVADARHRGRGRRPTSFGSDEELDSDTEDEPDSRHGRLRKWVSGRRNPHKNSYSEDDVFSASEYESNDIHSRGKRSEGNRMERKKRFDNFRGRGDYEFVRDSGVRSKTKMGDRSGSSHGQNRGFQGDDDAGRRRNKGSDGWNNFKGAKREGLHKKHGGKSHEFNMDRDFDRGQFRNSHRVIER